MRAASRLAIHERRARSDAPCLHKPVQGFKPRCLFPGKPHPSGWHRLTRTLVASVACLTLAALAGCTAPIGATRTTARHAYMQVNGSALDNRQSDTSRLVLHRFDLEKKFRKDPVGTLQYLHEQACADKRRDVFFALAELNYLYAEKLHRSVKHGAPQKAPDYFLASAIYSWLYLLGDGPEPPPGPFDRRFSLACDLYNRAVARGFATPSRTNAVVILGDSVRDLGPGRVIVRFSKPAFRWSLEEIEEFLPADEYLLRGLTVRDRQSGLGAPLIAVGKTIDQQRFPRRFPATLFLRVTNDVRAWCRGDLQVSLELYSTYDENKVEVAGRTLPLEGDTTAPLAYSMNDSQVWALGSDQFFSPEEKIKSNIYFTQPYQPGRIPVIFVHGTMSSPVWWAEMWNTLRADHELRDRCQFWNFIYNSGKPFTKSAADLRQTIERKIRQLDPTGQDPALRQMVVIGHSQGGLLTKLTATDTGDQLWRAASDKDFATLPMKLEDLEMLRGYFFFQPVPSVTRVVFISTPHRGSYLAVSLVRDLARRFMSLPADTLTLTEKFLQADGREPVPSAVRKAAPTSLDQMSPKNKMLLKLAEIPVAPGVKSHSIIAIKGDGPPEKGGDGVVKYTSAHVPYADTEFIVRSGHSCQDKPPTIEEVRRILLEHLADLPPAVKNQQSSVLRHPATSPPK